MDEFLKVLSQGLTTLLVALLPVLVGFGIAWMKVKVAILRRELMVINPDLNWLLDNAAELAVRAAEQLGVTSQIEDKLDYAVEIVKVYLAQYGLNIDVDLIVAAVEAEVREQFPKAVPEGTSLPNESPPAFPS